MGIHLSLEGNTEDLPRSGRPKLWDTGIEIYAAFWKKIRKKVLLGCQKNMVPVHQKIP